MTRRRLMLLSKEEFECAYVRGDSIEKMRVLCGGVSKSVVFRWRKKFGLLKRPHGGWKLSEETIGRRKNLKIVCSDHRRKAISIANKGRPCSEDKKRLLSEIRRGFVQSIGTRRKISISHKGRVFSESHKDNLSRAMIGSILSGKKPGRFRYRGYMMRSSWEVKVAEKLDASGILWEYESRVFMFGNKRYVPDFYLFESGEFLEVKGFYRYKDIEKMNHLVESGEVIYVVDSSNINGDILCKKWVVI